MLSNGCVCVWVLWVTVGEKSQVGKFLCMGHDLESTMEKE